MEMTLETWSHEELHSATGYYGQNMFP